MMLLLLLLLLWSLCHADQRKETRKRTRTVKLTTSLQMQMKKGARKVQGKNEMHA